MEVLKLEQRKTKHYGKDVLVDNIMNSVKIDIILAIIMVLALPVAKKYTDKKVFIIATTLSILLIIKVLVGQLF